MWNKIKQLLHRLWFGPTPPRVNFYEDIESVESDLLKPNGVEYRFPSLLKPPKVKFKMKQPRIRRPS